jgi:hypothetical protein
VTHLHRVTLAADEVRAEATLVTRVDLAVTEVRMTAFTLILASAIAVGVAAGIAYGAWIGVLSGVLTALVIAATLAAVYRVPGVRRVAMEAMHRITGA